MTKAKEKENPASNGYDRKTLVKRIGEIQKAGLKMHSLLHETAVGCLIHAATVLPDGTFCNDVSLLTKLYFAMPPSARREAFRGWCKKFAPVTWVKVKDGDKMTEGFKLTKAYKDAPEADAWLIAAADAAPFYETTEAVPHEFALDDAYNRLVRLVKAIRKADTDGAFSNAEKAKDKAIADKVTDLLPEDLKAKLAA
jgi:hypothetical protein